MEVWNQRWRPEGGGLELKVEDWRWRLEVKVEAWRWRLKVNVEAGGGGLKVEAWGWRLRLDGLRAQRSDTDSRQRLN